MGAAALPIAIGMTVGSKLLETKAQVDGLKGAARTAEGNARNELATGARQEIALDEQARATAGDAIVAAGMNGGGVGSGSALDALRQTAVNAQLNRLNVRAGAGSRANAYYDEARLRRRQAKGALVQGLLGAGAQALTGASQMGAFGGGSLPSTVGSRMPVPSSSGGVGGVSVMSGWDGGL